MLTSCWSKGCCLVVSCGDWLTVLTTWFCLVLVSYFNETEGETWINFDNIRKTPAFQPSLSLFLKLMLHHKRSLQIQHPPIQSENDYSMWWSLSLLGCLFWQWLRPVQREKKPWMRSSGQCDCVKYHKNYLSLQEIVYFYGYSTVFQLLPDTASCNGHDIQ